MTTEFKITQNPLDKVEANTLQSIESSGGRGGHKIELKERTEVLVKPAVTKNITSITITRIIDYVEEQRLSVLVSELGNITIAEGEEYVVMGDLSRDEIYRLITDKILGIDSKGTIPPYYSDTTKP